MKPIYFGMSVLMLFCVLLSMTTIHFMEKGRDLEQKIGSLEYALDHYRMFDAGMAVKNEENYPTGLYFGDGFFCVWTKDRTYSQVMESCNHEYLHYRWGADHFEN